MIIDARDDVVTLEGAIEKNLWPTIQAAANLLLRHNVQGIIIDGSHITSCTSEGAFTFRDALDYIERYHARIVVSGLPNDVMETLRSVPGVRSRLPIAGSIDEARNSLSLAGSRRSHAPASGRQLNDILVPLAGAIPPETATALACRIAKSDGSHPKIHLVYVLEVPRILTLNAPLPEEESIALRVIAGAEAIVKREGLSALTHVTRARDAGDEIINQAKQIGASVIVIGYIPIADAENDTFMVRVTRTLLNRAPCEVIINKLPVKTGR